MLIFFYIFLYSQDVRVRLNTANGSSGFQVLDVNNVVVSSITSDGNIEARYGVKAATLNITGVGANVISINEGAIQDARIIGDDIKASVLASTHILDNTLTGADILNASVTGDDLRSGIISSTHIAPRAILPYHLFIQSTFTYNSGYSATTDNANWRVIPGMFWQFDISTVPAIVVVNFSAEMWREENNNFVGGQFRAVITPYGTPTMIGFNELITAGVNFNNTARFPISINTATRIDTTGTYTFGIQYKLPDGWTGATLGVANASFNSFWIPLR
ncbi:MAG: hypothetical protein NZ870_02000 [bacterium]|nr:hypothetical protein [bacterium]